MLEEASRKIGVCLYGIASWSSWCILATDSGGNKRYWVCRGDCGLLFIFKLNKKETIELGDMIGQ
jgi:hypothetical protein